mgnify:CR=1 FL=1
MLTLHFTLPLKAPVKAKDLTLEVYDREYFVDFSFAEKDPVKLVGAPAQCKLTVARAAGNECRSCRSNCSQLGPDQRDPSLTIGAEYRQQDLGEMPVKAVAGGDWSFTSLRAGRRRRAVILLAGRRRSTLRLRAGAARSARRAQRAGAPAGGMLGWIFAKQAEFYRAVLEPDPRRQGRRQRGLEPVRRVLPLRHLSRRRARPRQGGDLVLSGRQ